MTANLEGCVALVTGASRGIGAGIAAALAQTGARVYGTATTAEGASGITTALAGSAAGGQGLVMNVNDPAAITGAVSRITEEAGAPTVLVNNAGITRDQLLLRMSESDWTEVIDTDLRSVYLLSKACLRGMMKARFGRIINISSIVAEMGNAGQANYAAAKAGMIGFSRSLAREVGSRGITVNVIAPGFVDTDMTRALDETQRDALLRDIPLQRLGEVADIAAATVFLASPSAGYITGQTLHVNGGMYMG